MSRVRLELVTKSRFLEPRDLQTVLETFCTTTPALRPERYGAWEPLKHQFDCARVASICSNWDGGVFLWGRTAPRCSASIHPCIDPRLRHGWLTLNADSRRVDPSALVALMAALAAKLSAEFGFVHELVPDEVSRGEEAGSVTPLSASRSSFSLTVPPLLLGQYIPDLYWVTLLGPSYVELFGAQRIRSLGAGRVQMLPYGGAVISLTEDLRSFVKDPISAEAMRVEAKRHLDSSAFFESGRASGSKYNVPGSMRVVSVPRRDS